MKIICDGYEDAVLFHANELYRGDKWYDWGMVQFDGDEGQDSADLTCPAKILGFFKYVSSGIPTPYLNEEMDFSTEHIYSKGLRSDTTMYAVVHTASTFLSWNKVLDDFVSPFTLGNVKDCVYIVDINCLAAPLFVFQDVGGVGTNNKQHFCVLPYKKWGRYFGEKVHLDDDTDDSSNEC